MVYFSLKSLGILPLFSAIYYSNAFLNMMIYGTWASLSGSYARSYKLIYASIIKSWKGRAILKSIFSPIGLLSMIKWSEACNLIINIKEHLIFPINPLVFKKITFILRRANLLDKSYASLSVNSLAITRVHY